MANIILITPIKAPIEKCFDLSRSVEIHLSSTKKTNERVVEGRTAGLFEAGEVVTWEAKHFGIVQRLTVKITKVDKPYSFEDVMVRGAFKSMVHVHSYEERDGVTYMKDEFRYETPFGVLGKLFDALVLKQYMKKFLKLRNEEIKMVAESV